MPTKIAPENPGSTFNERTGMWTISSLETHWSCPEHPYGSNRPPQDCPECGEPEPVKCLDCLFGERLVTFDGEGWATLTIERRRLFPIIGGASDGGWEVR